MRRTTTKFRFFLARIVGATDRMLQRCSVLWWISTLLAVSARTGHPSNLRIAQKVGPSIDCNTVLKRGVPAGATVVPTKTVPSFNITVRKSDDVVSLDIQATGLWDDMATFFTNAATTVDSCSRCGGRRHFVDIGANIGAFALTAASLKYSVIAFEPFKHNLALLRYSVCANGFEDRVRIIPVALSDQDAMCELVAFPGNLGDGIVQCGKERLSGQTRVVQKINTKRLDDYASLLPECAVMKVDVEGFEPKVLQGGTKFMTSSRAPLRVKTEMNVPLLEHNAFSTAGFFWQWHFLGYRPLRTAGTRFDLADGELSSSILPASNYTNNQGELFDVQFVPATWSSLASRLFDVCNRV